MPKTKLIPDSNTIDGLTTLTSRRRDGNSTRQIDYAIQLIATGKTVQILDHCDYGKSRNMNKLLFRKIMDRLTFEHAHGDVNELVEYDKDELIIKIKKC